MTHCDELLNIKYAPFKFSCLLTYLPIWWLGRVTVTWTRDREVVGSPPGRVAIEWLLLGWVTVYGQVNLSVYNQPLRSTQPSIPPG